MVSIRKYLPNVVALNDLCYYNVDFYIKLQKELLNKEHLILELDYDSNKNYIKQFMKNWTVSHGMISKDVAPTNRTRPRYFTSCICS